MSLVLPGDARKPKKEKEKERCRTFRFEEVWLDREEERFDMIAHVWWCSSIGDVDDKNSLLASILGDWDFGLPSWTFLRILRRPRDL